MPRTNEPPDLSNLSTLAGQAADAAFAAMLQVASLTEDVPEYSDLLKAAGVAFDDEDRTDGFRDSLPSDELRTAFDAILRLRHHCEFAREQAGFLFGIAIGKRLARSEGAR